MVFVSDFWLTQNEANIREILKACDDLDDGPLGEVLKHSVKNIRAHAQAALKGVEPERAFTLV